jgi:prophage DNA circulation protein
VNFEVPYELIIDGFLALLMAGVIYSAFVLNQRITNLKNGQEEMNALVSKLDAVTRSAQMSVEELKNISTDTHKEISQQISKARGLADELSVITQAGDNLAGRLDKQLSNAAAESKASVNKKQKKSALATKSYEENLDDDLDEEQKQILEALKLAR